MQWRGCLYQHWCFFLKAGVWTGHVPHVYLQQTEVGDRRSVSFYGQVCLLLIHLCWEHIEPPGVGPWLFQRTVPNLLCTQTKANLGGVLLWVLGCEPIPAWTSNSYRCDLWQGTKSPWTSTFSSAKWCIWHVLRIK